LVRLAPVQKLGVRIRMLKVVADSPPPPPAHLSPSAQQWWQTTVERYELEEHHLRLLQLACEAWDRAQEARARLAQDGLTVSGREGGLRPHPCVGIERDARLAVARLVRELDLDVEPPVPERRAPPAIFSNRDRRHAG
jgi:P27 family predicted phage terminase small subunit